MSHILKKSIAVLLTLVIIMGLLPLTVLAAEGDLPDTPICRVNGVDYNNLQTAINAAPNGATITILPADVKHLYHRTGLIVDGKTVTVDTGASVLHIGRSDYSNPYGVLADNGGSITFIGQDLLIVWGKTGFIARGGGKISVRQKPYDSFAGVNSTVNAGEGGDGIYATGEGSAVYLDGEVMAIKSKILGGDFRPGAENAIRAESGARVDVTGAVLADDGWGVSASGAGTVVNVRQAMGGDDIGQGGIFAKDGARVKAKFASGCTGVQVQEFLHPNNIQRPLDAYTTVEVTDDLTGKVLGVYNNGGVVIVGNKFTTPDGYIVAAPQTELGTDMEIYQPFEIKEEPPVQYKGMYADYDWYYFNEAGTQHSFTLVHKDPGVCVIGSQRYDSIKFALDSVKTGETIKLLRNATYREIVQINEKQFTIDLNGRKLEITNPHGPGISLFMGARIDLKGKGEFNVVGTSAGVTVYDGSQITVTNATATAPNGIGAYIGPDGGENARINVLHDAKGTQCGTKVKGLGHIQVGSYEYAGDAVGETQAGAWAEGGGTIMVFGDAKGKDYGAYVDGGNEPIFGAEPFPGYGPSFKGFNIGEGATILVGKDAVATGDDGIGARAEKGGQITVTNDAVGSLAGASVVEQGSILQQTQNIPATDLPTILVGGDAIVTGAGGSAVANCHGIVVVDGAMKTNGEPGQSQILRDDGTSIYHESSTYYNGYDPFDPSNIRSYHSLVLEGRPDDWTDYNQMVAQGWISADYANALILKFNREFEDHYWYFGALRAVGDDNTGKVFSLASHSYTVSKNKLNEPPKEEDYVCRVSTLGKFTSFDKALEAIEADRRTDDIDGVPGNRVPLHYAMYLYKDIVHADGLALWDVKLGVVTNGHNLTLGSTQASYGLYLNNAAFKVREEGAGEVRAIGIFNGAKLINKSSASITSVVCDKSSAAFLSGAGGAYVAGGSTLTLKEYADGANYGVYAEGKDSEVTVEGNAMAESQDSTGAQAADGAKVTVEGNAEGKMFGAQASGGGTVTVKGNATSGSGSGAAAFDEKSKVTVSGNAIGEGLFSNGAYAGNKGSVVVGGNAMATNGESGAAASGGGKVTVGANASGGSLGAGASGGGSSVTVNGLAIGINAGSIGAAATGGGKVTVKSGAQGFSCGALASGVRSLTQGNTDIVPSSINISGGTATGTGPGSCGAQASGGATVSVSMDAEGEELGAAAFGVGSKVTVKGSAKSAGTAGVYAAEGGVVAVTGDAVGYSFGVYAINEGTRVTVNGKAYALDTVNGYGVKSDLGAEVKVKNITGGKIGAVATSGGKVTVEGKITGCVHLVALGDEFQVFYKKYPNSVTSNGYLTYSDNVSTVWINEESDGDVINEYFLPLATQDNYYSAHILCYGGQAPVTWTVSGLPSGLSINSATGVIRGTPRVEGDYCFTITAEDNLGQIREFETYMVILPGASGARITSGAYLEGKVGQQYTDIVIADYGTPPYSFAVSNLPPGIEWNGGVSGGQVTNGSNATFCSFDGIPMRMGIYNVIIFVEDNLTSICLIIRPSGDTDGENCDFDADSLDWGNGSSGGVSGFSAAAGSFSAFGGEAAAFATNGAGTGENGGVSPAIMPMGLPAGNGGGFFAALGDTGTNLGDIVAAGLVALNATGAADISTYGMSPIDSSFVVENGKIVIGGRNPSPNEVKYDLNLPTEGGNGSTIRWTSTNPAISTDGKVTRPPHSGTNATGVLTATVTNGSAVRTVNFPVTVLKLPESSTRPVCEIDGAEYMSIFQALTAIGEGESKTIKLLQDVTVGNSIAGTGCSILIWKRNVTIDLNGFDFTIDPTYLPDIPYHQDSYYTAYNEYYLKNYFYAGYYNKEVSAWRGLNNWPYGEPEASLMVMEGSLHLTGDGEFNINGSFGYGVFVWDGEATVTNVTGRMGGGYVAGAGSRLTVRGDATNTGVRQRPPMFDSGSQELYESTLEDHTQRIKDKNYGVYAAGGAEAIVYGSVTSTAYIDYGIRAVGSGSRIHVKGNVGSIEGESNPQGAVNGFVNGMNNAGSGAVITVDGNVYDAVTAKDSGTVITVGGDVWGVIFGDGGEIFVKGDCLRKIGSCGVIITEGEVTIDGVLAGSDGFNKNTSGLGYISISGEEKNRDQRTLPTSKEGYATYTNSLGKPGKLWIKEAAPYFKIGDNLYNTWEDAYNAVPNDPDGKKPPTVVTLLRDYDRKLGILCSDKNILLNLGGYDFTIDTYCGGAGLDKGAALYIVSGKLNLTGKGELNIKAWGDRWGGGGIKTGKNGEVTVDNVECQGDGYKYSAISGSGKMTVRGNVTARGKSAVGVSADGTLTVYGDIIAEACGLSYNKFTINNSAAVYGNIIVNGNTDLNHIYGVQAADYYSGAAVPFVTVMGDVRVYKAAGAAPDQKCTGVSVGNGTVEISGSVISDGGGVAASLGSKVTVDGSITTAGTPYIRVGDTDKTIGNKVPVSTKPGYNEYSDGTSIVWVGNKVFVPVSNISNLPDTAAAGTPLSLSGTVQPTDASRQNIIWSLKDAGTTGAVVVDGVLHTAAAGTVVVTATVKRGLASGADYAKDFTVTVSGAAFVSVSGISGLPNTAAAGVLLPLTGTAAPADATNKTVKWSVKDAGTTMASIIDGGALYAINPGTVVLTATIKNGLGAGTDYVSDFTITVTENQNYVCEIVGGGKFTSLDNALGTVRNGQTIRLLTNIKQQKPIWIAGKTVNFNLGNNNLELDISGTDYTYALEVWDGGKLFLTGTGTGKFNITSPDGGVHIYGAGSEATVNNISAGTAGINFSADARKITVNGDITVKNENVGAYGIVTGHGLFRISSARELEIVVNGSITADLCCIDTGASDRAPKSITISGDLICTGLDDYYYAGAPGTGKKISLGLWGGPALNTHTDTVIGGSVISSVKGVSVYGGAKVNIAGNVRAKSHSITSCGETTSVYDPVSTFDVTRVDAAPEIWVGGSVSSSSYSFPGIQFDHGTLQIEGSMRLAGDRNYLALGGKTFEKDEVVPVIPTTKEGFTTYSHYRADHDHTATIWVGNTVTNSVIDIMDLPGKAIAGVPLTLSGTVWPPDASNQTIIWSIKDAGGTGAAVNGNIFTATAPGQAQVTATVADGVKTGVPFTKNFTIDVREFAYICEIVETGVQYPDVQMAIDAIGYGESKTIRLLEDIVHEDGVEIVSKTVTFDLNGFDLEIKTSDYTALIVRPAYWWDEPDFTECYSNVYLKGKGEFNITGDCTGIYQIGGEVTVSNVTAAWNAVELNVGNTYYQGGKLTVSGNIMITSTGSYAIQGGGGTDSVINVGGDVTGTVRSAITTVNIAGDVNGRVESDTGRVNINGDVSVNNDFSSVAVDVRSGGSVTVAGRINAHDGATAVYALGRNSTVTAGGVLIRAQGSISGYGIHAENRAVVHILGDCLIEGVEDDMYSWSVGIYSVDRAQVTIDGVYTTDTNGYLYVGNYYDDEGEYIEIGPGNFVTPTTKPGYLTYTVPGNTNAGTVWINAIPIPSVTLTGLSVTTLPNKTEYTEGENLDLTGMVVKATYSNGNVRDVTALVKIDPANGALLDRLGAQAILVSYKEGGVTKTTGFAVTVNEPAKLSKIKVVVPPMKLSYFRGELLDLKGMVVIATLSDGSEVDVTRFCETAPADRDRLAVSGTVPVTVSFTAGDVTETDTFNVEVVAPVVLESIAVTTLPYRTDYWPGNTLDLTGMVVRATYSDGSIKTVTGYTASPVSGDVLNTLGAQPVDISYTEGGITKTAAFNVDVSEAPVILDSITVTTPPNKTVYTQGETLNLSGMVVTAKYSDGSSKNVTADVTTAPAAGVGLNTAGEQPVMVSYTENGVTKTAMFTVDVSARVVLESIAVTSLPNKETYTVGDGLKLAGLEVTARYSDGNRRVVTGYGTSLTEGAALGTLGVNNIVVSYSEGGVTKTAPFTVTVNAKVVLEMIMVTTNPDKTYYDTGETLDLTGMVVTARYSNGSRKTVTGYTTGPTNGTELDRVGLQPIGISYTEDGVTKDTRLNVTVGMPPPVELLMIRVEELPDKLVYTQGGELDLTGMIVKAYYSDLSVKDVTSLAATVPGDGDALNTLGAQAVTVSYTEYAITKTAAFDVTVVEPGTVVLERIAVITPPDKATYFKGEVLDITGMAVKAYYSDGSEKDITSKVITNPADGSFLNTIGSQTVAVSYTEGGITKTDNFNVTVNAVTLDSITVTTLPDKKIYTEGDSFDLTGMVVTAMYNNGSLANVTALVTTLPVGGSSLNATGQIVVVVSYTEDSITKTAMFSVTVNAKVVLDSISVTAYPDKIVYSKGDSLDLTGLLITATYSDGNTADVTAKVITDPADGDTLNTVGQQTIEVTYIEDGITKTTSFSVSVDNIPPVPILDSITVTTYPNKTVYTAGEALDLTGMVVTAYYSDGSSKPITGYTANPTDGASLNTAGSQMVDISYTEDGVTKITSFTVNVNMAPVILDSIAVTTNPDKTTYTIGDNLDLTGMIVTATYSNGHTAEVTALVGTNPAHGAALNTIGTQTIEVSYTENSVAKTTNLTVTVNAKPVALESIAVTTNPDKLAYTEGEPLDLTGMAVTATYSDTSNVVVGGYSTSPANGAVLNAVGTQTVEVSYTENGVTKTTSLTVTVNAKPVVLSSIAVTTNPNKTTYTEGETLDLTGMAVTATYSDTSTIVVAGYTTSPANGAVLNTVGTQTVEVSYTENGVTKTTSLTVTVKAKPVVPSTYAVIVENDGNGSANADVTSATAGTVITLTVTPNNGYQFKEWQVIDGGVTITGNKFTMPANAVTVKAIFEPIPGAPEYKITAGASQSWKKGMAEDVRITCNGDLAKFIGLKMDGKPVGEANYTKASGSTIVTLKASYLETLAFGTHTVEFVYSDGSTQTELTILAADTSSNPKDPTLPKTGDDSNPTFWMWLCVAAVFGLGGTIYARKRKYRESK